MVRHTIHRCEYRSGPNRRCLLVSRACRRHRVCGSSPDQANPHIPDHHSLSVGKDARSSYVRVGLHLTLSLIQAILIKLWINPSTKSFLTALTLCGWTSFLFGWHVHEKAVLLILVPLRSVPSIPFPSTPVLFGLNAPNFFVVCWPRSVTPISEHTSLQVWQEYSAYFPSSSLQLVCMNS